MRVFWPTSGIRSDHGTAVGWKAGDAVIVVAVVDKVDNHTLKPLKGSPPLVAIANVVPASGEPLESSQKHLATAAQASHPDLKIWVDDRGNPAAYSVAAETVMFRPPGELEHLTLGGKTEVRGKNGVVPVDTKKDDDLGPILELLNRVQGEQGRISPVNAAKASRKRYITWARNAFTTYRLTGTFRTQMAAKRGLTPAGMMADEAEHITKRKTLPKLTIGSTTIGGYSYGKDAVHESPTPLMILRNAFTLYMFWSQIRLFAFTLLPYVQPLWSVFVHVMRSIAAFLSYKITVPGYSFALRDVSAFLNQVAFRTKRLAEVQTDLKGELEGKPLTPRYHKIRMATGADIGLGFITSAILAAVANEMPRLSASALTDPVIAALNWLNAWPVGLKLNTPLSEYLSSAFSTALVYWRDNVAPTLAHAQTPAIGAIIVVSLFGLSFGFALLADIISVLTLNFRLCYMLIAKLCSWQLTALKSLWDLFRGKRWNVLRKRTDSHAYDVDTLFLGTLLFTLMTFLAPTALAYGALFALINLAIVAVTSTLRLASAALDTLPAYQLLSRVIKPARVPAGIVFDQTQGSKASVSDEKASAPTYTLLLKSTPKSIPTILTEWFNEAFAVAKA